MSEPSDTPDNQPPQGQPQGTAPRRRRRVGKWVAAILAIKLLVVVVALAALMWYARGRDFQAPEWVNDRIEARLATALPDVEVTYGNLTLSIALDYQPSLHLVDVRIHPLNGGDPILMADVTGSFDGRALLDRQIRPKTISVTGARIHVDRDIDGQIGVAFGASQRQPGDGSVRPRLRPGPAQGDAISDDPIDQISAFLDRPAFSALTQIEGAGLTVQYNDSLAGRSWTVDGGQLALTRDGQDLRLAGNFALLGGHAYATTIEMSVETAMYSRAATLSLRVEDAPSRDIATQSPGLAWLGVLDAPISGALRVATDEDGAFGPMNATLQIGQGAVAPDDAIEPIPFESARTYFHYDPQAQRLTFDEIAVQSAWVTGTAEGRIDLKGVDTSGTGIPEAMVGQLRLTEITTNPLGIFPSSLVLERAETDVRLQFDPFRLQLGRFEVRDLGEVMTLSGWVNAKPEGWDLSLTGRMAQLSTDHLLALWPPVAVNKTREWIAKNVVTGDMRNIQLGVRSTPNDRPRIMMGFDFENLTSVFNKGMPPVQNATGRAELRNERFAITFESGRIYPREEAGEGLDVAGSSFVYENVRQKRGPAEVRVNATGDLQDVLTLIDSKPLNLLSKSGRSPDLAQGRAQVSAQLNFNLIKNLPPDQIDVSFEAELTDVTSDVIVPKRTFRAPSIKVKGTQSQISATGRADLGGIPVSGTWSSAFGPEAGGGSKVEGYVTFNQQVANALNLGLPPGSIGGEGQAKIALTLPKGGVPKFDLTSDLAGISANIAALNWGMSRGQTGDLRVSGTLGQPANIDRISLDAPGLSAAGSITLQNGGGLERARFDRVRLGGWLDAPVTLTGRGKGVPPRVAVTGGSVDLRRAKLAGKGGDGGPLVLTLDRLTVSDTIALTGMRGEFTNKGGLNGQFVGRVNGAAPISGTIVPRNGQSAVRISADNAGAALAAAGLLKKGRGGALSLTLNPTGADGTYDGMLRVENIWLQDAPAMASLLSALSVVGLLEQMSGNGIHFTEVEADFRLSPQLVTIRKSSAVGASMGISMDGYYNLNTKSVDMQGVVSPVYAINGIGQIFTRKGEGLLGFNYNLKGPAAQPAVNVNPLSIFTPGMFREIFRRPAPQTN
ncbi:AsmA-like C-terminal region-containing protein [Pseudooceanicola sp. MF1-13]|uniref:YhdP family protein n=1 Tax=Pseudooceanicola sp. MF1-13 TaxID=3379095 RepID=UPI003892111A